MKGELSGRDPMEAVLAAFSALSRPDSNSRTDGHITFGKLQAVCHEFEVRCALDRAASLHAATDTPDLVSGVPPR